MTTMTMNEQIVALREKTGAGMMDCKKALTEANGDFDKALENLRKKGLADAAKKSSRTTKEGLVAAWVSPDGTTGAIIELQCETDFVAKTPDFQNLAKSLAQKAGEGKLASVEAATADVQPVIGKLGENMALKRFERFQLKGPGLLAHYIHPVGFKNGAFIQLEASSDAVAKHEATAELAKELGLQIVAAAPRWVAKDEVPAAEIEKEKEIYAVQLKNEGKPEASIPKIVEGKVNKLFFQQFCLLEMASVRDPKTTMSKLVADAAQKAGGTIKVARFVRYQLGA
ncbi:MAG: translation elongation factor Ts [Elusimicrobia bacterium]|nr:translation elongation factor Ts [Elusimicrobiota bacterium]